MASFFYGKIVYCIKYITLETRRKSTLYIFLFYYEKSIRYNQFINLSIVNIYIIIYNVYFCIFLKLT